MTTTLNDSLKRGDFIVTGEVTPPRGADGAPLLRQLEPLVGKLHAVNVTDNPGASVHASAVAGAVLALQAGIEPIMQITCRDRNRIALQSDLLGAWILGVRAIMALTGDPPTNGDHPDAKPVFDLDSFGLISAVAKLRAEGLLINGKDLARPPSFLIGAAEAPFAGPVTATVDRLERKVDAGVDFVQTQFIFDVPRFVDWLAEIRRRGLEKRVRVLAGVGIVRSSASAVWLHDHVPGSGVPDWLAPRFAGLSGDEAERMGLDLAVETINQLRAIGVDGVHLLPIRWRDGVVRLLAEEGFALR